MTTSGSLSEREPESSRRSIYERVTGPASEVRPDGIALRAATGVAIGAACGLVLSDLGIPQILGVGRFDVLLLSAVIGGGLGVTRFRKPLVWLTVVLIVLLCGVGFTGAMREPARRLVRSDPPPLQADAIVVLSAGVTADGMLQQQGLDRLLKAIELVKAGVAQRIVVTRERKRVGDVWVTAEADQARLLALGGGAEVISTGIVASTREEALRVAEMARSRGWSRMVLVTSPFHSRRACATFEKAGVAVSCVPSESRDVAVKSLAGPETRVRAFGLWLYELAGTLRYWQAGWI